MMRALAALVAIVVAASCGDNSKACGEGTNDLDGDGMCEADVGGDGVCGTGTRVDPVTMECVVDPLACGGGTVLVNGRCEDPAAGIDIDLEEGPEPNGFEPDGVPAGVIDVPPIGGDGFVVHGCIRPLDAATPDHDVYLLSVTAPTLLDITADGVQGLAAGFRVTSTLPALASWERYGIDLATDLSRRQVLLPAAGTYRLEMTDSRTLLPAVTGGSGAPPAGNLDGTSCYYVSIAQLAPAPVALDPGGDTGTIDDGLVFYSASGLSASTTITATIASPYARAAIVVLDGTTLRAFDDDGSLTFDGSGTPTIVLDLVFHYALSAVPYTLALP